MKTNGKKKATSGNYAFRQGENTWMGLVEALELLEWLEFQSSLWGYSRSNQDYMN